MMATLDIKYAGLSNIELRRLAQENVAKAEETARTAATAETETANSRLADLAKVEASIADAKHRRAELERQVEDARRERGEALANG
jgi:hypothetical protein